MANFNKVILMGNITRDPEIKMLPSGTAVCEFGLAINRNWTAQDGTKKEEVTFVDISAFGNQAETLTKYVKKGSPLHVEGRLKLDQWEAQDGSKRSKLRVILESFQFLGSKQEEAQGEYQGEPQRQAAPRGQARPKTNSNVSQHTRQQSAAVLDDTSTGPGIPDDDIPFAPNLT